MSRQKQKQDLELATTTHIVQIENGRVQRHILPKGEETGHVLNGSCPCLPTIEKIPQEAGIKITHTALRSIDANAGIKNGQTYH